MRTFNSSKSSLESLRDAVFAGESCIQLGISYDVYSRIKNGGDFTFVEIAAGRPLSLGWTGDKYGDVFYYDADGKPSKIKTDYSITFNKRGRYETIPDTGCHFYWGNAFRVLQKIINSRKNSELNDSTSPEFEYFDRTRRASPFSLDMG